MDKRQMIMVPLTYPLPSSERVELGDGKWGTRQWTPETQKAAEMGRYKFVERDVDT